MEQKDEPPVEREKSRWWPTRRGAMRIFAALIAVGVLLFVVRGYYVGFLLDNPLTVLGAATVVVAVVVLIRVGQHYEWTGFGKLVQPKPDDNRDIQPRKTLWDWLQLLIVPVALAGIGFWFTAQQDARQQQIENQRAKAEQELAEQRAQDEALQTYLKQMSSLLIEKDLRDSAPDSEVRKLAQTLTLTVLDTAEQRRRAALRFLYESDLIDRSDPVISLDGANLQNMDLRLVNLSGGNFVIPTTYGRERRPEFGSGGVDLRGADLSGTNLSYGALSGAALQGADFRGANLTGCAFTPDLSNVAEEDFAATKVKVLGRYANLPDDAHLDISLTIIGYVPKPEGAIRADLEGALFNNANLRFAIFQNADLAGADLINANLRRTWLVNADLNNAVFRGSNLSDAQLDYARLTLASFEGADLTGADLHGASGLDGAEIAKQAKSLKGATMPDGQKYEDWLKSKGRAGEDGKNTSSP